jgi:tripartite motif-containing protein 71
MRKLRSSALPPMTRRHAIGLLCGLVVSACGLSTDDPTPTTAGSEDAGSQSTAAAAGSEPSDVQPAPTLTPSATEPPTATELPTSSPTAATMLGPTATSGPPPATIIYVADTLNNRIQMFDGAVWSLLPGQTGQGIESGQFEFPCSVAVDSQGNVYVTDSNNHRIQRFDGEQWEVISDANGPEIGQFLLPYGIAVDSFDRVWVADSTNGRIQIWDGVRWTLFDAEFGRPEGVAVDSNDNVYVADTGANEVIKIAADGTRTILSQGVGDEPGQFIQPWRVTVDGAGTISVIDFGNARLQQYDGNNWTVILDDPGSGAGQMEEAYGLVATWDGTLYLADTGASRIQANAGGGWWVHSGGTGIGPTLGEFFRPRGVAVFPPAVSVRP